MKKNFFLWLIAKVFAVAMLTCVIVSCDKENIENDPIIPDEQTIEAGENGSVDFDISSAGDDSGEGTSGPITVTPEEEFDLTISQKSSYTDPNGKVFECEPKANIKLEVKLDTVYVKDINSLIKVNANVDASNKKEGSNPTTYSIDQKVTIGEQIVDFDISYESYTYVNSQQQNVLMPYIKLNQAEFANAVSGRSGGTDAQSSVTLADIRICKISPETRSIEVTDTTFYEVTAKFNVRAEVENSSDETSEDIALDVVYVGAVMETRTYPGAELSYEMTDANGNVLDKTNFNVAYNSTFTLNFNQISSYTDENGVITPDEPLVAWTKITSPDVLKINKAGDLAALVDEVKIETYSPAPENNLLPYYSLSTPKLDGDVVVSKISTSDDGISEVYKAVAKYTQKATPVNVDGASEIILTYEVEYQGTATVELLDETYEKEIVWEDKHDNIPTNYRIIITRKRTYSNGDVIEDVFKSDRDVIPYKFDSSSISKDIIYEGKAYFALDTIISYGKRGIPAPNLDGLKIIWNDDSGDELLHLNEENPVPGVWTTYQHEVTEEYYTEDTKVGGYYKCRFEDYLGADIGWMGDNGFIWLINEYIVSGVFDRFFYIDGKLITFDPMTREVHKSFTDAKSETLGDVKVLSMKIDATYLGRTFHYALIDTLYLLK